MSALTLWVVIAVCGALPEDTHRFLFIDQIEAATFAAPFVSIEGKNCTTKVYEASLQELTSEVTLEPEQ